jgi:hypothetical protein
VGWANGTVTPTQCLAVPKNWFFLPTLIPLSGVGTTCLYYVVIKIRHLFLRPAASLTSTLLETGVNVPKNWFYGCKIVLQEMLGVPAKDPCSLVSALR